MSGIIGLSPDMRSGVVGVFPDGHVLQVVQHFGQTEAATTSASAVVAVAGAITVSNSTNKVLAIASVTLQTTQNTSGTSVYAGISLDCTSATSKIFGPYDGTGYAGIRHIRPSSANDTLGGYYTVQWLFEPDLQGVITVTVNAHGYPGLSHSVEVNTGTTVDGTSTLTLMEVVSQ